VRNCAQTKTAAQIGRLGDIIRPEALKVNETQGPDIPWVAAGPIADDRGAAGELDRPERQGPRGRFATAPIRCFPQGLSDFHKC
jgi:hypothetical protein